MTQLRSAIRKVLSALDEARSPVAAAVRRVLRRDDDYAGPGKPPCDWDDPAAREVLVDELVKDALSALGALDGQQLPLPASEAADLLALVAGQDVEQGGDGVFRIARKTAKDRVIFTVDTAARHGHKCRNRHCDGYKAHLSADPDSELTGEVAATAANTPTGTLPGSCLMSWPAPLTSLTSSATPRTGRGHPRGPGGPRGSRSWRSARRPQCRRPVPQGPLRRRSGTRHRDLPGRAAHRHRPGWPGRRQGIVPALVRRLPAAICVHQRPPGPHHRPSIRTRTSCRKPAPSSVTPPGSSATGQTGPSSNARSPISPAGPGRPQSPHPAGWPASPPVRPRRGHQLGPPGRPRARPRQDRLGTRGNLSLTAPPPSAQTPQNPGTTIPAQSYGHVANPPAATPARQAHTPRPC